MQELWIITADEKKMENHIKIISGKDIILWRKEINELSEVSYPAFVLQDNATIDYGWDRIYKDFLDYQIIFLKKEKLAAVANSIPLFIPRGTKSLPDEGWDWALISGYRQFDKGIGPNALIGLSVMVNPAMRGCGLSKMCIYQFKELARKNGLKRIYIPVRPTKKQDFPDTSFDDYIVKKVGGRYFDPWLNLHYSLGGKFINICRKSMFTVADLKTWKKWTGVEFSKSGSYAVPGALEKIIVNKENNQATYSEPNVWMEHSIQ